MSGLSATLQYFLIIRKKINIHPENIHKTVYSIYRYICRNQYLYDIVKKITTIKFYNGDDN